MKKIIIASLTILTLISCEKEESQTLEKNKIEEFKEKYNLEAVPNNENFMQFETIEEAEKFIKGHKTQNFTFTGTYGVKKDSQYFFETNNINTKGIRLKNGNGETYVGFIDAGLFSSFRLNFETSLNGYVIRDRIYVTVSGLPVLWSWSQNGIRNFSSSITNCSFIVEGHIAIGISVGGQGLAYNDHIELWYNISNLNSGTPTVTGTLVDVAG